ncbi:hypothetical protein ACH4F6_37950 [Streptomyces sp. NPDC017936]|uniref:hypothetical protein n=1 Tax=Streptomyces sp. NPDC017936 TaxID=3365016 RepID=UPI0037AC7766
MTIDFLPDEYRRAVQTTVVIPVEVPSRNALTDPSNGRVVLPARVEIILTRFEGVPSGDRTRAYVAVIGPRRLKSGAVGKPIAVPGWETARNDGPRGYVDRPAWLTDVLAENLPDGWDPALLELPKPTRYGDSGSRLNAHILNEDRPAPYAAEAEALCGQTLYKVLGPTPDGLAVCERCLADMPCAACGHPEYAHRDGDSAVPGICVLCEDDSVDHDYRPAAERP